MNNTNLNTTTELSNCRVYRVGGCPYFDFYNTDCMEIMKQYPDNHFDLAIVDPPYGINVAKMAYTQEDNRPVVQKNGSTLRVKKLKYKHGEWDKIPADEKYLMELQRVSKHQIIWGINYMDFHLKGGRIVWDKCVPDGVSFSDCEIAYCSLHDRVRYFEYMWAGMMQGESLGKPNVQKGNKKLNEKRIHPTQKPEMLYSWLIKEYAKPDFKILDTHLGSASIAIAVHKANVLDKMNLHLTGIEIDVDYFQAAMSRIKKHVSQTTLKF
jgi:site-specific DNA-methyltransferase (adenine-specific)